MKKITLTFIVFTIFLASCSNKEAAKEPSKIEDIEISEPVIEEIEEEEIEITPTVTTFTVEEDGNFNVSESIDFNGDMKPETLTISGGSIGDDYTGQISLSIQKGEDIFQRELFNEGSSTFYIHDLNNDGTLELLFNGGYRIGLLKLYVLTDTGLHELEDDISGWVAEITHNEIITDRGTYTFDGTNLLDQQGSIVTSLIDPSLIEEEEEYEEFAEEPEDTVEIVEKQPKPAPKDNKTLAYEEKLNDILYELEHITIYFNEVIANEYPGNDYMELANVMTSIALKNHSLQSMKVDNGIPSQYFGAHDDLSKALEYYVKAAEILAALCYSSGSISDYHIYEFEEKYDTRINLATSYLGYAMDDYFENGFVME